MLHLIKREKGPKKLFQRKLGPLLRFQQSRWPPSKGMKVGPPEVLLAVSPLGRAMAWTRPQQRAMAWVEPLQRALMWAVPSQL